MSFYFQLFSAHHFKIDVNTEHNETVGNETIITNKTSTIFYGTGIDIPDDFVLTKISGMTGMTFTFNSSTNNKLHDLHVGKGIKLHIGNLGTSQL